VVAASASFKDIQGGLPKDLLAYRNNLLSELEVHLSEGKPAETFIEKYKL